MPRVPLQPVTIVGPGRLGRSLHTLLRDAGADVQLVGREPPPRPTPWVLLTVPDRAIGAAAAKVPPNRVVLHTSGALGLEVLGPHAATGGSFHPLMTFPGPEIGLPPLAGVPAAIDGSPEATDAATALAEALGMQPLQVPGDRRLYHAAAVLAGNFATVLLAEGASALRAAGVPDEQAGPALVPLAVQSLLLAAADPAGSLTGPAARGDEATIRGHLDALDAAGLQGSGDVYRALTERARELLRHRAPPD
jgi:predicted short-subunit dehydrogenase-like oxidoreductase (DUF2520 family)